MTVTAQLVKQEKVTPTGPWAYKPIGAVDESQGAQDAQKVILAGPDGKIHHTFLPPFLPPMAGNAGKFLTTNGTTASWDKVLPDYVQDYILSNDGQKLVWVKAPNPLPPFSTLTEKYLKVEDGVLLWASSVNPLPSQTGHANQFLMTDGVSLSWSNTPVYFQNPMTTKGDMIVGIDGGGGARLPIGATGQVLQVVTGMPQWGPVPSQYPPMSGQAGKFLQTNGSVVQWADAPTELPSHVGQAGRFLRSNGAGPVWVDLPQELPAQSGKSGMFLTTDGTSPSWTSVAGLLPAQTGNAGKYLSTDGTSAMWRALDGLPSQVGHGGKVLTTDGSVASWKVMDALPAQTGQGGKFLTTDGTVAKWEALSGALPPQTGQGGKFLTTDGASASWASVPSGFQNPMTSKGDIIMGLAGGTPTRLGIGSPGQVLGVTPGGDLAYIEGGSSTVGGPVTDSLPWQLVQRDSSLITEFTPIAQADWGDVTKGTVLATFNYTPRKPGNTLKISFHIQLHSPSGNQDVVVRSGILIPGTGQTSWIGETCEQRVAYGCELNGFGFYRTTSMNSLTINLMAKTYSSGDYRTLLGSVVTVEEYDPAFQVNLSATRGSLLSHAPFVTPATPQTIPAVDDSGVWLTFVDETLVPRKNGSTWKVDGNVEYSCNNIGTTYFKVLINSVPVWSGSLSSVLSLAHSQYLPLCVEFPSTGSPVRVQIMARRDNQPATLNAYQRIYRTEIDNTTAIIPGQYGTQVVSLTSERPWRGVMEPRTNLVKYNWGTDTTTTNKPGGSLWITLPARSGGDANRAMWCKQVPKTKSVIMTLKTQILASATWGYFGAVLCNFDGSRWALGSVANSGSSGFTPQAGIQLPGGPYMTSISLTPWPKWDLSQPLWYRFLVSPELTALSASKDGINWNWFSVWTAATSGYDWVRNGDTFGVGVLICSGSGGECKGDISHLEIDENLDNCPVSVQGTYTIGAETASLTRIGPTIQGSVGVDRIASGTISGPLAVLNMVSGKRHTILFEEDGSAVYVSTFTP